MTRNIRWWNRLSFKLGVPVALVTLATIGVSASLAVRSQRRHMLEEVTRGGEQMSETIKSSIYHQMLLDRREEAYLVMETIGRQKGIEGVRMFNPEGRITFSTNGTEIGATADRKQQGCNSCHGPSRELNEGLPRRPDPGDSASDACTAQTTNRIYESPHGHRVLGLVTPVYNEASCSTAACHAHPEAQRVLGVIDIGLSLESMDRSIDILRRDTTWLAAVAVVVLALVVFLVARGLVVRPVLDLVKVTRQVAERDLGPVVEVRSNDELGMLAASFNDMTVSLRAAQAELGNLMASLEHQVEERTAALRHAQEQLIQSEKLSSLGRLSASIAHEINNPLMGILTIAKLLLRTLDAPGVETDPSRASALKQLRMVQRETERCSAIVRNLLDFARQKPLALKELDVRLAVEEALSVAANQMSLTGIALERDLAPVPPVRADLGQVRQAVLNVVLNACDAMARGGRLQVTTRSLGEEGMVQIEVADTGSGISPEHLSKIFDPFFTTKEKGTGLGLSVVYGIVQRHGGKLDVRSQKGQGTTVFINLPAALGVKAA